MIKTPLSLADEGCVGLDVFVSGVQVSVEYFRTWWLKQSETNPEGFPMVMGDSDWAEQYLLYCENTFPKH